ncbi:ABC transporter permease subunit [Streptomyces sp. NPDC002928]|uniref:ABC transporter permease n=1 Tax=Streptomyces sp. NPDC002928 TaxID=3154440 RepID=UPI0033A6904B
MKLLKAFRGYVFFAVVLGIWQLVGNPDSPLAPTPSRWWPAFKTVESNGTLWTATAKSLELYVESLVTGLVIGVVLGIAIGGSRVLSRMLGPLLEYCRTTPPALLVPAAVLLFGLHTYMEIGIVVFASVWPVLLSTAGARRALPEQRLDVARTLHFSWWKRMRKIVLPSLVPEIALGVRVAVPLCLLLVLLVDFLLGTGGLGYVLIQSQQSFASAQAWALVAFIGVLGRLITVVVDRSERLVLRRWPTLAADAG